MKLMIAFDKQAEEQIYKIKVIKSIIKALNSILEKEGIILAIFGENVPVEYVHFKKYPLGMEDIFIRITVSESKFRKILADSLKPHITEKVYNLINNTKDEVKINDDYTC